MGIRRENKPFRHPLMPFVDDQTPLIYGAQTTLWVLRHVHGLRYVLSPFCPPFLGDILGTFGGTENRNFAENKRGISFPNFDRHNGVSAKKRLKSALRQQKQRSKKSPVSHKCHTNVTKNGQECKKWYCWGFGMVWREIVPHITRRLASWMRLCTRLLLGWTK